MATNLAWTKTKDGYAANGATTRYDINRTPGRRFALLLDSAEVMQGKLVDLKAVAQRNENASGGADDGPKSATGRPTGSGKPRTNPKPSTPTATNPEPPVTPTPPVAAVEVPAVDAYPPRNPTPAERNRLEHAMGENDDAARRGAITPEQHDANHVAIIEAEQKRRADNIAPTAESPVPDYIPPEVGNPVPECPEAKYGRQKVAGIVGPYVPAPRNQVAAPPAPPTLPTAPSPTPDRDDDDDTPIHQPDIGNPVGYTHLDRLLRSRASRFDLVRPRMIGPGGRVIGSWLGR